MRKSVLFCLLVGTLFVGDLPAGASPGKQSHPFYAMDTCVWIWKDRTPDQVASLLKELGYDGYGHGGTRNIPEYLEALKKHQLKMFNTYVGVDLDSGTYDPAFAEVAEQFQGTGAMLWVYVTSKKYDRLTHNGDDEAVKILRSLADMANRYGVSVALYPHTHFYVETVEEAVRIAKKVDRPNLGVTFNLCHHLKVIGEKEVESYLAQAMPYLFQVSINGADSGETKNMGWDRLIQTLDAGSYDVSRLVQILHQLGYRGPIGLQGYGLKGNPKDNLTRSIKAWQEIEKSLGQ